MIYFRLKFSGSFQVQNLEPGAAAEQQPCCCQLMCLMVSDWIQLHKHKTQFDTNKQPKSESVSRVSHLCDR